MNRIAEFWDAGNERSSSSNSLFLIAEIGSNHLNDISLARESIAAAAESGADAVKFQSINLEELYYSPNDTLRELHAKIDTQESWYRELKSYADERRIVFFSSPTYLRAVDLLESLNVELYKLASAQVGVFPQLVEKVARLGKPTILSSGLVTIGELEHTIRGFHSAGNHRYILLHCNSIYPTPPELVYLERMLVMKRVFGCPVGFSDHTVGNSVALAAVAKGADVIEKHFALSRSLDGPDAFFSSEPNEFAALVKDAKSIRAACAPCEGRLEIEQQEQEFKEAIRYRLVLMKRKDKSEPFGEGDFEYKRHETGIDCRQESIVIQNMRAALSLEKGALLQWSMLEGKKL